MKKGGLNLSISEKIWENTFSADEQMKAETILSTLDGMSIASAKELLTKCGQCIDTLVIHSYESH